MARGGGVLLCRTSSNWPLAWSYSTGGVNQPRSSTKLRIRSSSHLSSARRCSRFRESLKSSFPLGSCSPVLAAILLRLSTVSVASSVSTRKLLRLQILGDDSVLCRMEGQSWFSLADRVLPTARARSGRENLVPKSV